MYVPYSNDQVNSDLHKSSYSICQTMTHQLRDDEYRQELSDEREKENPLALTQRKTDNSYIALQAVSKPKPIPAMQLYHMY